MKPGAPKSRLTGPIRLLLPYTAGQRRNLTLLIVLSILGGFAEAVVLLIIARAAFALASSGGSVTLHVGPAGQFSISLGVLIGIAAVLVVVRVVLQLWVAEISAGTYSQVHRKIRVELIRLYLGASWALQSEERSGRLQELATTFASAIAANVFVLTQLIVALSSLIVFVGTALVVNVTAAVIVTVAGLGMGLLLRPLRTVVRRRYRAASLANLAFATDVSELTETMQEVRVFDVDAAVFDRMRRRADEAARLDRKARYISSVASPVYQGVALLMIVGAIAVVYLADLTRLASFGGILLIVIRSLTYGQATQGALQGLQSGAPVIETLDEERARLREAAVSRDGAPLSSIGDIGFEDVGYAYQTGVPVLTGVTFRVPQGEAVGIVGPSGAGKSTLVQLILRLREPTSGRVVVDGQDVAQFSQSDWFKRVSFVPQEPRFFAGTIAENIAFHRDDVDHASIERAARLANLHDEIVAMADGYDTWVGEGGVRLSGGQRQRLCIARALAEDPDVIVLDEPTSALDVKSEALIRASLAGLAPRTTVFIIAHRLSTLDICGRIMVIHEGRLQGFDTPSRLEQNDPFYREALALSGLR